ncbi:MAG: hypothetical protein JSU08_15390 [Acidobacteria bacterium]|nr:hypothetical protein [Acidobacteriota bacterium]
MTRALPAFLTAMLLSSTLLAQQGAPADKSSSDRPAQPRTLTLTGCVEKGVTPNQYTIADELNGKYEVSGSDIRKYLGKRVQVAGVPGSTRLRVKGGLWPTPNVAAQGGAIDPGKAAIAAQPGGGATGTGDVNLPTLKVKSVRTLDGGCK